MRERLAIAALLAAVALFVLAAGCGDESGQDETTEQVSIPSPTSPIAPGTTTAAAPAAPQKKQTAPATGGTGAGCSVPGNYEKFEFAGTDCATALAVAAAWEANQDQCNTIDDPNSPEGYKRSCSVEGYSCDAKRDVRSDGRFVSCSMGGASVRFTWFPN